jgi:hypothetical protein
MKMKKCKRWKRRNEMNESKNGSFRRACHKEMKQMKHGKK